MDVEKDQYKSMEKNPYKMDVEVPKIYVL